MRGIIVPKYASTILLIVLIVSGLASISTIHFGSAQTSTPVNGIITQDTTWRKTNSPYNLMGNVLVNNGVTLKIEDGVTINLNKYYMRINDSLIIEPGATINMGIIDKAIQINGVLSAKGTSANPIHINGVLDAHLSDTFYSIIDFSQSSTEWNRQTNLGSIIENVVLSYTTLNVQSGILFGNNTYLSGNLVLSGGSPTVLNNNITSPFAVIGGSPLILNNKITSGLSLDGTNNLTVVDNVIYGLSISDAYGYSSMLLERNLISSNAFGVLYNVGSSGSQIIIRNNTITNNAVGLQITNSYPPIVIENNIYNNSLNVRLAQQATIDVNLTNNWWGTTNQPTSNQPINLRLKE